MSTRVGRGPVTTMVGFGLSMALLAAASLVYIPSLIRSGGTAAWAAIATGQAIGSVAAVVVILGWGLSGPASIVSSEDAEHGVLYRESLIARAAVTPLVLVLAAATAALASRHHPGLAALGAVTTGSVGLSASWYYIGLGAPWRLLVLETMPRVLGTAAGIVLMENGLGPAAGIVGQLTGMGAAVVASTAWIGRSTHRHPPQRAPRPLAALLRQQTTGLYTSLTSATYNAVPVLVVGVLAHDVLPSFALVDKLQKQVYTALTPVASALQGWVPRGRGTQLRRRALVALVAGAALCLGLAGIVAAATPWLMRWLGAGQLAVPLPATMLAGAIVGTNLYESIVARSVLIPLGRLKAVSRITSAGSALGLALLLPGSMLGGTTGALSAVLAGLVARVTAELVVLRRQHSSGADQ